MEIPDDQFDPVAYEFVGHRHALLRIGHVVAPLECDLLAEKIPPALLMSSTASWVPLTMSAPKAAFGWRSVR